MTAYDAAGNRSSTTATSATTSACPAGDTQAPTTPTGVAVTGNSQTSITLGWNASTDNVGVTGYGVYSGGVRVGTTASRSYTVSGLTCGTSYALGVDAYDAANNRSVSRAAGRLDGGVPPSSASAALGLGGEPLDRRERWLVHAGEHRRRLRRRAGVLELRGGVHGRPVG